MWTKTIAGDTITYTNNAATDSNLTKITIAQQSSREITRKDRMTQQYITETVSIYKVAIYSANIDVLKQIETHYTQFFANNPANNLLPTIEGTGVNMCVSLEHQGPKTISLVANAYKRDNTIPLDEINMQLYYGIAQAPAIARLSSARTSTIFS